MNEENQDMKTKNQKQTTLRPANFFLVPILPYLDPQAVSKSPQMVQAWPAEYCREVVLFALD